MTTGTFATNVVWHWSTRQRLTEYGLLWAWQREGLIAGLHTSQEVEKTWHDCLDCLLRCGWRAKSSGPTVELEVFLMVRITKCWNKLPVRLWNFCPWRFQERTSQSREWLGLKSVLTQLWAEGWTRWPSKLFQPEWSYDSKEWDELSQNEEPIEDFFINEYLKEY